MKNLRTLLSLIEGLPIAQQRRALIALAVGEPRETPIEAAAGQTLDGFKASAADAFEGDMKPVVRAIVGALKAGDTVALQGLRSLLPHLLEEVNSAPALADLLAHQLGKAVLEGFQEEEANA